MIIIIIITIIFIINIIIIIIIIIIGFIFLFRLGDAAFCLFFSTFYRPLSPLRFGIFHVFSTVPARFSQKYVPTCHFRAPHFLLNLQGLTHASFYTNELEHPASFYTNTLLHQAFLQKPALSFTPTSFYTNLRFHSCYTNELLHAPASMQTNFPTNQLLQTHTHTLDWF